MSNPETWSALFAQDFAGRARTWIEEVHLPTMGGTTPVQAFRGSAGMFAQYLVTAGAEETRRVGQPYYERVPSVLRSLDNTGSSLDADSFEKAAAFVSIAEGCAAVEPALAGKLFAAWVAAQPKTKLKKLDDRARVSLALGSLALGEPALAAELAGAGKKREPFAPKQTFRVDIRAFIRYLAAGLEAGAGAEDVRPAWLEIAQLFPILLDSTVMEWTDLTWAARAYYHGFEKRPVGEVGAALHQQARAFAER